jgi:predicted phosphodiesterase
MKSARVLPGKIGLLADSHSDLEGLETAVSLLRERGAAALVHLGDICDSLRLDLLESFVRLIRKHDIHSVKGNNDFILENLLAGRPPEVWKGTEHLLGFLQGLPMKIVWDEICFAHSLPFDFLRAFYEPIDVGTVHRARDVFQATPYRILFCGHSHQPVLFKTHGGDVSRERIPANRTLSLDPEERYIHVIGAVSEGECALFDTQAWTLERLRIPGSGVHRRPGILASADPESPSD